MKLQKPEVEVFDDCDPADLLVSVVHWAKDDEYRLELGLNASQFERSKNGRLTALIEVNLDDGAFLQNFRFEFGSLMDAERAARMMEQKSPAEETFGRGFTWASWLIEASNSALTAWKRWSERTDQSSTGLPWRSATELRDSTPERPNWIVPGFLARQAITELSAKVKVGKTTLTLQMVKAIVTGEPFLGRPTTKAGVIYLTEEREATFRDALERAGLLDHPELHILHLGDVRDVPWERMPKYVISKAQETHARIVAIDTLPRWARLVGDEEQSAGMAALAMGPVEEMASADLAVFTDFHDRKAGGELGDSSRGSSAFAGAGDILLNLRRANTQGHATRRTLAGVGRFSDIPEELTLELREGRYVSLGVGKDVEHGEARQAVVDIAPREGAGWMTRAEFEERLSRIPKTTLQRALDSLEKDDTLVKEDGHGKTGRAFAYALRPYDKEVALINERPNKDMGSGLLINPGHFHEPKGGNELPSLIPIGGSLISPDIDRGEL